MKASQLLVELYNPEDDEMMKAELSDVRRPRLTLRHLHKLRKMREMQAIEHKDHVEFVTQMYGSSGSEESEF